MGDTYLADAQFARSVILDAERPRHAALAVDSILEGDGDQVALQVVLPGMVDAEVPGFAALLEEDQRAAMRQQFSKA